MGCPAFPPDLADNCCQCAGCPTLRGFRRVGTTSAGLAQHPGPSPLQQTAQSRSSREDSLRESSRNLQFLVAKAFSAGKQSTPVMLSAGLVHNVNDGRSRSIPFSGTMLPRAMQRTQSRGPPGRTQGSAAGRSPTRAQIQTARGRLNISADSAPTEAAPPFAVFEGWEPRAPD
jgi:hypothetical protein